MKALPRLKYSQFVILKAQSHALLAMTPSSKIIPPQYQAPSLMAPFKMPSDGTSSFPLTTKSKLDLARQRMYHRSLKDHQQNSRQTCKDPSPNLPSKQSYFASPHSTLSVDQALRIISDQTPEPVAVSTPVTTSVIGSVIAEDVFAAAPVPGCRVSAVDGYAILIEEDKCYKGTIASIIRPSVSGKSEALPSGTVARLTPGSPLPPNANAVVRGEDTMFVGPGKGTVQILKEEIHINMNIRETGSCIPQSSRILARGNILSSVSGAASILAMAGIQNIKVFEKPRVGVLSLGQGLTTYSRHMLEANRLAVTSGLVSWGFETTDLSIDCNTLHGKLEYALRSDVDVLLIINDTSISELDLKPTIEHAFGGTLYFDGVSTKPSSHTAFGTIPVNASGDSSPCRAYRPIFSLPSDPASALIALNLFVLPSLNKFSGVGESSHTIATKPWMMPNLGLSRVAVVLAHKFALDPQQTEYHLAVVTGSRSDARLYATSVSAESVGSRSDYPGGNTKANALIILRPGRGVCIKGEIVEALLMGPVDGSDTRLIC